MRSALSLLFAILSAITMLAPMFSIGLKFNVDDAVLWISMLLISPAFAVLSIRVSEPKMRPKLAAILTTVLILLSTLTILYPIP